MMNPMDTIENLITRAQTAAGMNIKLRDLIKLVRSCKTAAEEREVISKECATIRNSFSDENSNKHRNVAKLLYIHMLGYPTQFGQMECLKLIVSPLYPDKRLGYLALMLLLDETSELLTLATNAIQNDLQNPNQFICGLALCALANIASVGIAQDCAPEIEKLLASSNPYLRKKAALAALKIVRKCPQIAEQFLPKLKHLITDKNHAVLVTGITLITEVCEMNADYTTEFKKLVPYLLKILKSLIQSGYAPEHDVSGVTDPFLQVKILRLLRILGKDDKAASEQMNDLLASVATNTESVRNVGNAILYECVQTIMGVEAESALRVLGINILGKFLANKENNMRYVALNSLCKVVDSDLVTVQRHRNTIVDCLKDPDISIRRRALDLVYKLVNETNVRILVRELLNYLTVADTQFKSDIVAKLCWVTEMNAPSKRWHFDTILRVIASAGDYVPEEVPANLIAVISQTPELQSYAVKKLYTTLLRDTTQPALLQVALWSIGEYGDLLISGSSSSILSEPDEDPMPIAEVNAEQVLDLLESILRLPLISNQVLQYALSATIKLTGRLPPSYHGRLKTIAEKYQSHINLEIQQRSCEYVNLIGQDGIRKNVVARLPPKEDKNEMTKSVPKPPLPVPEPVFNKPKDDILSILGDLGTPTPNKPPTGGSLITDLFGGSPASPTQPAASGNLLDLLGSSTPAQSAAPVAVPTASGAAFTVFQKNGLQVSFSVVHPPGQPSVYNVTATYTNTTSTLFTEFSLKVAVPKWMKFQLNAAADSAIQPNTSITQLIRLANTQHGTSPVLLKLRFDYKVGGNVVQEPVDVAFPAGI